MKKVILLLSLVFLIACSTIIKEKIEPLTVIVKTTNTSGILSLQTKINCNAQGGKTPYAYNWKLNDTKILEKCTNASICTIFVDIIGNHKVTCEVMDSNTNISKDNIILTVEKKPVKIDNVITFGDSLTYGSTLKERNISNWAYLYIKEFTPAMLFNYARPGAKTSNVNGQIMIFELDSILYKLDEKNKLIFIWIGSNDVLTLVPLTVFRNSYSRIIRKLITVPNAEIIIINIPDVTKLSAAGDIEQTIDSFLSDFGISINLKHVSKSIIRQYNNIIQQIASQNNIPVIDMFSYLEEFEDAYISEDRFHPNEQGHKLIKEKVKQEVEKFFPKTRFY